jgi:chemosensory pili system protein ChpA (sensor histidine kinase/response regulator)
LDSQELLLDWEEEGADALDTSATDLEIDESLWDLDEPEVASAQTASAGIDALTGDFDSDATSTNPFNFDEAETDGNIDDLFENEALSSVETPENAAFNDQEDLGDLFGLPTADPEALMFEELDLESLIDPEAIQDFDAFNDFFDTEEATDTSADETTSDFDDFSVFELPTATEHSDSSEVAAQSEHPEMLLMPEAAFEEDLFDLQPPEAESVADSSESLFDTNDDALFDDIETAAQAGAEDLEALFGDETSENTEALDLSPDAVNFEEDFFASHASAQELDFELEPEALFFDGETDEVPQAATEDLDALWDEETPVDTDQLNVSEENLFETEITSDWELESANEETADDLLDWDAAGAGEEENLDDFLSAEAGDATDAQDWNFEGDEAAAALGLDWDIADNDAALEDLAVAGLGASALAANAQTPDFEDLEALLADSEVLATEGDQLPMPDASIGTNELDGLNEFDDLEALLGEETSPASAALTAADLDAFDDLDALLNEQMPAAASQSSASVKSTAVKADAVEDDFGDLEKLLEQAEKAMGGPPSTPPSQGGQQRPLSRARPRVFEQTMRVPVKHLDSLSNLVGELVVNRNSLEQDQELLRQFLDNLSHQILALSDVGARMQDLYERSLLESSLLASRQSYRSSFHAAASSHNNSNSSGVEYDPLEMDRFTGFHLLSQEMIELIVRVRESASDIEFLVDETDQVARMLRQVTTQLQEGLTRSRMVPFAQNADRLLRAVHEISRKLGKEAQLHVDGRETLIDKMILEHLYDPMTHLVNNALTHGIEMPEVRRAAGKPIAGQITLRAFLQGNQTVISISDDGAGINPEKIRSKVIEKRLITPAEAKTLSRLDLYDFLFHAGFTTKDKADDFSGRGVGMDVVRTSLSEIRGTIHIDSTIGKGTTFTIRLPLTLSICKALCCLSERARIAFPMDGVEDMLDLSPDRIQTNSEGQTCIQWRDTLLPFQSLSELLKYNRQVSRGSVYGGKREDNLISIVVLRSAGNFIAIQVDQVLGEQEIVIKQLEGPAPKPVGIAGATVLGDGRIMPIADVLELIDLAMGRIRKDGGVTIWSRENPQDPESQEIPEAKSEPMVLIVDDSITVRELLSMTFNKAGYRVEQARDGQEAWDKLRSGLPCDIVFCDIEMPRMDGLELLSRLQKDETLCKLPIAMLTSRGADRHRQMAAQLGANGYFTKPYLEEVLLEAANRMIKGEVLFGTNSNA